jgi:hypothetical protein
MHRTEKRRGTINPVDGSVFKQSNISKVLVGIAITITTIFGCAEDQANATRITGTEQTINKTLYLINAIDIPGKALVYGLFNGSRNSPTPLDEVKSYGSIDALIADIERANKGRKSNIDYSITGEIQCEVEKVPPGQVRTLNSAEKQILQSLLRK